MTSDTELKKQTGIAITGGIGCGKSTIGKLLRELSYTVIDADVLAKAAVATGSEGLEKLVEKFGPTILNSDGSLNRQLAAESIFKDSKKKAIFEGIIHPIVEQKLKETIVNSPQSSEKYWFYEIPLLFEKNLQNKFFQTWVANCPQDIQIDRISSRDKRPIELIKSIIANQYPQAKKVEQADVVIETNCSFEEIKLQIEDAIEKNLKARESNDSSSQEKI